MVYETGYCRTMEGTAVALHNGDTTEELFGGPDAVRRSGRVFVLGGGAAGGVRGFWRIYRFFLVAHGKFSIEEDLFSIISRDSN